MNVALTSYYGYTWEQLKQVVVSYRYICPNDDLVIFSFCNPDQDTIINSTIYNFKIYQAPQEFANRIVVNRFLVYSQFLENFHYDYAVCVDAADIHFQKNPFTWMEKYLGDAGLVVGSEQLRYADENWGNNNLKESFPNYYDFVKDHEIMNAGSFGGKAKELARICKKIFDLSKDNLVHNPDQAALNVIARVLEPQTFKFTTPSDGWSYQCGTSSNDVRGESWGFNRNLIGCQPKVLEDKIVNENNEEVCIVHQYHHSKAITDAVNRRIKNYENSFHIQ